MRRVGTYSCLVNYLRVNVCVSAYMSVCVAKSVQEMRVSDMNGCLHDELWYFVPNVHNFRPRSRIYPYRNYMNNTRGEFFIFILTCLGGMT